MVTGRLALTSLIHGKARDTSPPPPPPATAIAAAWTWPSSKSTSTQPARAAQPAAGSRTVASVVLDYSAESSFTASSARQECSDSLSTASEASAAPAGDDEADDAIVRGIRSDRLLFDPDASATSSILEEKSSTGCAGAGAGACDSDEAFVGGVAVVFESADPYADFRASMEEMVAAHGVGDWCWLEEMLGWYLRANDQDTHCAIVSAFIDVVVAIADPAREPCSSRSSSCTFPAGELGVVAGSRPRVNLLMGRSPCDE